MEIGVVLQEMRESLGVRLEGNVVIVDEAHNIVDAVNSVHSAKVSVKQLGVALSALDTYYQRFRTRLAPGVLLRQKYAAYDLGQVRRAS
jgi:chromosome transmission fidelity protein 1